MNEYNINVDFIKGIISTNLRNLVQNDYNSTKLNFTFDKEGRVLFKMLYPDGTQYVDEVKNNILIFGPGILNQEGTYEYEISLYTEDGRLTDYATKSFEVRSELVDTDELVAPDDRVPVLDTLINEVSTIKQDVEDGKYNGKDGVNGIDGKNGATPNIGDNGNWFIDGVDTGMPSQGSEGPQGPAGGVSLEEVKAIIGELENLGTTDKSSLVNAINEVSNNAGGYPTIKLTGVASGNTIKTNEYYLFADMLNKMYQQGTTTPFFMVGTLNYYKGLYCPTNQLYEGQVQISFTMLPEVLNSNNGVLINQSISIQLTWIDGVIEVKKITTYFGSEVRLKDAVITSSSQTITGTKTFDALPKSSVVPTDDTHLVNKKYVDDAITTAITTSLEASY